MLEGIFDFAWKSVTVMILVAVPVTLIARWAVGKMIDDKIERDKVLFNDLKNEILDSNKTVIVAVKELFPKEDKELDIER